MKNTLFVLALLIALPAFAQQEESNGVKYLINRISQLEQFVKQLIDVNDRQTKEIEALKKYKENSWLP